MLRFLFFLLGIGAGFVTAMFVLPLPGKTFFNKMSRLPDNIKNLIDNVFDLSVSMARLGTNLYGDIRSKIDQRHSHTAFEDKVGTNL